MPPFTKLLWKSMEKIQKTFVQVNEEIDERFGSTGGQASNEQYQRLWKEEFCEIKERLKEIFFKMEEQAKKTPTVMEVHPLQTQLILDDIKERPDQSDLASNIEIPFQRTPEKATALDREMSSKAIQVSFEAEPSIVKIYSREDDYSGVKFESKDKKSPEIDKYKASTNEEGYSLSKSSGLQYQSIGNSPIKTLYPSSTLPKEPIMDDSYKMKPIISRQENYQVAITPFEDPSSALTMAQIADKLSEISSQLKTLKSSEGASDLAGMVKSVKFGDQKESQLMPSTAAQTKYFQVSEIQESRAIPEESEVVLQRSKLFKDFLPLVEAFNKQLFSQESESKSGTSIEEGKMLLLSKFIEAFSGFVEPKKVKTVYKERLLAERSMDQAPFATEGAHYQVD